MRSAACGRRGEPRAAACAVVLAMLSIAQLPRAHAGLVLTSGPPLVADLDLAAARPDFAPRRFAAEGHLAHVRMDEWAGAGCPRAYTGPRPASMRGALVLTPIDAFNGLRCSFERQSTYVRDTLGGMALVRYEVLDAALDAEPGQLMHAWHVGDARSPAQPLLAADIVLEDGPATRALLGELDPAARALGHAPLRARLSPDVSAWTRMRTSVWVWLVHGLLLFSVAAVLELAGCRLYAILRADGGFRWTTAQWLLALELVLNTLRALYLIVDPGVLRSLPVEATVVISGFDLPASAFSFALFIAFHEGLGDRTRSGGFATPSDAPHKRRLTSAVAISSLGDMAMAGALLWTGERVVTSVWFVWSLLRLVATLLAGLAVRRSATDALAALPLPLATRISRSMRFAIAWSTVEILALVLWRTLCHANPWRALALSSAHTAASTALSYVLVAAFKPLGVEPARGPLRRLYDMLRRTSKSTVSMSARLKRAASVTPSAAAVLSMSERGSNLQRHLLLGVSPRFLRELCAELGIERDDPTRVLSEKLHALTRESGLSLAELRKDETTEDGRPAVAGASLFVCHAQSCSFLKLLDAVDAYLELHGLDAQAAYLVRHRGPRCCSEGAPRRRAGAHARVLPPPPSLPRAAQWIDALCIRQHAVQEQVHHIGAVIARIGHVVMVLDPWDKPVCLSRVWWCARHRRAPPRRARATATPHARLPAPPPARPSARARTSLYEAVHCATNAGVIFHLTMAPEERGSFVKALMQDRRSVEAALQSFDARTAQATFQSDKQMIFQLIREKFGSSAVMQRHSSPPLSASSVTDPSLFSSSSPSTGGMSSQSPSKRRPMKSAFATPQPLTPPPEGPGAAPSATLPPAPWGLGPRSMSNISASALAAAAALPAPSPPPITPSKLRPGRSAFAPPPLDVDVGGEHDQPVPRPPNGSGGGHSRSSSVELCRCSGPCQCANDGDDAFERFNSAVRGALRTALAAFSWPSATPAARRYVRGESGSRLSRGSRTPGGSNRLAPQVGLAGSAEEAAPPADSPLPHVDFASDLGLTAIGEAPEVGDGPDPVPITCSKPSSVGTSPPPGRTPSFSPPAASPAARRRDGPSANSAGNTPSSGPRCSIRPSYGGSHESLPLVGALAGFEPEPARRSRHRAVTWNEAELRDGSWPNAHWGPATQRTRSRARSHMPVLDHINLLFRDGDRGGQPARNSQTDRDSDGASSYASPMFARLRTPMAYRRTRLEDSTDVSDEPILRPGAALTPVYGSPPLSGAQGSADAFIGGLHDDDSASEGPSSTSFPRRGDRRRGSSALAGRLHRSGGV